MGRFADIPGNENAKRAFLNMADSGKVPHALMLHENDGSGAIALVLTFLQYLNCENRSDGEPCGECPSCRQFSKLIYPDMHFVFPITTGSKVADSKGLICDKYLSYWRDLLLANPFFLENELSEALGFEKKRGQILIAEAYDIIKKLSLSSVSGGYRSVIIYLPEAMSTQTANKLLKTLEEPTEKTIFILITHSPESVLQTISSRCQPMRISPLTPSEVSELLQSRFGYSAEDSDSAAAMSGGSIGMAVRELSQSEDVAEIKALVYELFERLVERDYLASLEVGERIAALESREKQKLFCTFAGNVLRNVFLIQQGLNQILALPASEEDFLKYVASKCSASFSRKAISVLNNASLMLVRNVAQKIIFTNVVDRLYLSL